MVEFFCLRVLSSAPSPSWVSGDGAEVQFNGREETLSHDSLITTRHSSHHL